MFPYRPIAPPSPGLSLLNGMYIDLEVPSDTDVVVFYFQTNKSE